MILVNKTLSFALQNSALLKKESDFFFYLDLGKGYKMTFNSILTWTPRSCNLGLSFFAS